jgi:hypothetical protein
MKYVFIITALLVTLNISAQQKALLDQLEDIENRASEEFIQAMTPSEGGLYLFARKFNIQGAYTFKISIGDKNKVTSVFVLEREGGDIQMQNKVKDVIKDFKFDTFKVPKGKHYNMKYTFNFN